MRLCWLNRAVSASAWFTTRMWHCYWSRIVQHVCAYSKYTIINCIKGWHDDQSLLQYYIQSWIIVTGIRVTKYPHMQEYNNMVELLFIINILTWWLRTRVRPSPWIWDVEDICHKVIINSAGNNLRRFSCYSSRRIIEGCRHLAMLSLGTAEETVPTSTRFLKFL